MLQAFAAAFRTPDLRRKLLFSLAMIAIYRLGAPLQLLVCVFICVYLWLVFGQTKTPRTSQGEALGVHGVFRER